MSNPIHLLNPLGAAEYTAGDGISIQNDEISVKVDGSTVTVNGEGELVAHVEDELPSITGNSNKILSVNSQGSGIEWIDNDATYIINVLGIQQSIPQEVPEGYLRLRYTGNYIPSYPEAAALGCILYRDNINTIDLPNTNTPNGGTASPLFTKGTFEIIGGTFGNTSTLLSNLKGATGLTSVSGVSMPDSAAINNYLFWDCTSLQSVSITSLGGVNDLSGMFSGCTSLTSVSLPSTSSVTTTKSMFSGCTSLTTVTLFDTSSVTDMSGMFHSCTALTTVPLFDTSSVTDMSTMFKGCTSIATVPLFDTSAVTNMNAMFQNCTALATSPLFDTSSVTGVAGGSNYTKTGMANMFNGCTSLTSIPLFNTSSAVTMYSMFAGCVQVESGALALYTQASTQSSPPSKYYSCFTNCGSNTVTGTAELAQIPTSWGGTMV